jgi:thioredoxin 1
MEVDTRTFGSEVEDQAMPVIVDFYADWCAPCRATAPTVRELARSLADEVRFVKVNIDRSPELARRFGVRSIPTFIRFDAGEVSRMVVGVRSAAGLTRELALSSGSAVPGAEPDRIHRWWPRPKGTAR